MPKALTPIQQDFIDLVKTEYTFEDCLNEFLETRKELVIELDTLSNRAWLKQVVLDTGILSITTDKIEWVNAKLVALNERMEILKKEEK